MGKAAKEFVQVGNYRGCNFDPDYHRKKYSKPSDYTVNKPQPPLSPASDSHADDRSSAMSLNNSSYAHAMIAATRTPQSPSLSETGRDQDYSKSARKPSSSDSTGVPGEREECTLFDYSKYPPKPHDPVSAKRDKQARTYHPYGDRKERWDAQDRLETERRTSRNWDSRDDKLPSPTTSHSHNTYGHNRTPSRQRSADRDRDTRQKRSDEWPYTPGSGSGSKHGSPTFAPSTSAYNRNAPLKNNDPVSEPATPSIEIPILASNQVLSNPSVQLPSPAPDAVTSIATASMPPGVDYGHLNIQPVPTSYQDHFNWVTDAMISLKEPLEGLHQRLLKATADRDQDQINSINQAVVLYQEQVIVYQRMLATLDQYALESGKSRQDPLSPLQQQQALALIASAPPPPEQRTITAMITKENSIPSPPVSATAPTTATSPVPSEDKNKATPESAGQPLSLHKTLPVGEPLVGEVPPKRKSECTQDNEYDKPSKPKKTTKKGASSPVRGTEKDKTSWENHARRTTPFATGGSTVPGQSEAAKGNQQPPLAEKASPTSSSSYSAAALVVSETPLTSVSANSSKAISVPIIMPQHPDESMEGVVSTTTTVAVVEKTERMNTSAAASIPSPAPDTPTNSMKTTARAASTTAELQGTSSNSNQHAPAFAPATVRHNNTPPVDKSKGGVVVVDPSSLDLKQELAQIREETREQRLRMDQLMDLLQCEIHQRRQAEERLADMSSQLQEQNLVAIKRDLEAKRADALTMMYKAQAEVREASARIAEANKERAEAKVEALRAQAENQKLLTRIRDLESGQGLVGGVGPLQLPYQQYQLLRQTGEANSVSGELNSLAVASSSSEISKGYMYYTGESDRMKYTDCEHGDLTKYEELPDRILFMQREPLKKPRAIEKASS
ncbi:hypothetical protein B0O80DRAFT_458550 [Mortierella sp. GBAus27b]|nr:hypothetical protein B0O80DRAFT_458550 [Mortierella sp. GBAus27b]